MLITTDTLAISSWNSQFYKDQLVEYLVLVKIVAIVSTALGTIEELSIRRTKILLVRTSLKSQKCRAS